MLKRSADTVVLEKVGVFFSATPWDKIREERKGFAKNRHLTFGPRVSPSLFYPLAESILASLSTASTFLSFRFLSSSSYSTFSYSLPWSHFLIPAAGLKASRAAIFKAYAKSAPQRGWMHEGETEREMGRRQRGKKFWTMAACVRLPGIRLATIYVTSTTRVLIVPSLFHSHPLLPSSVQFLQKNPLEMTRSVIFLECVKST